MTKSKKAILVVGPPRSGTSVVAHAVSQLGVYFGDPAKFVDPDKQMHNPVFFELSSLNEINDAIFKYFSKKWADFDWMPDRSVFSTIICSKFAPVIASFVEKEFGDSEVIGLKDPRFCYTLPLWETVLTRMGFSIVYILVRRSSSAVFISNQMVNRHSSATNFRLVAQSNILSSRFVRSRPFIQVFYEELLNDPAISIRAICETADLPVDRIKHASSVLNRNLQHHDDSEKPLYKYFSSILDAKEIDPGEYDRYREIHLASTHDKNETIERLNRELAEKEQGARDFPYWREALKVSSFLWRIITALAPKHSRLRGLASSVVKVSVKLYRKINDRRYQDWIRNVEVLSKQEFLNAPQRIENIKKKPLISVLMPVYNPPIRFLDDAIKSVKGQIYPHWELCIVDDASPNSHVRECIEEHARDEPRIHYLFRNTNGHISVSSNSALGLATGEFTALLDHDDILHPLALLYVAEEINAYPDVEVVYSDEDRLSEQGKRTIPYFKPDFDYDLLLSQNMVSHLGVYRTETMREVGGFRIGFEGSQDYDLLLRVIEKTQPRQIRHIPHVLYHWRISNESAASGSNVKPYAYDAGLRVIRDHLARQKIEALVEPTLGSYAYRVKYAIPHPQPTVDIIICGIDFKERLDKCIDSILLNTRYQNYGVSIIRCGGSNIGGQTNDVSWIQDERVSVVENEVDTNQSRIINQAVMKSKADYICLLDENIQDLSADWLELLVGQAAQSGVGAVGPLLLLPNGKIHSSGIILNPDGISSHLFAGLSKYPSYHGWATIQRGFSVISDLCVLVKKTIFLDIGGYNEAITTRYYANIDFCLKLKEKGMRNVVTPNAELHLRQGSVDNQKSRRKVYVQGLDDQKTIKDRWQAWFNHDPAFNPNLDVKRGRIIPIKPQGNRI